MATKEDELQLYSHALSPYALKVRCYLLYKELPFTPIYIRPGARGKQLPVGRIVPVLCLGDDCRNESSELGIWLDEQYPDTRPLLAGDRETVLLSDQWVTDRLIPTVFRVLLGHGDSFFTRARKRWSASSALNQTVPGGVSLKFRINHLRFIHRAPFIARLIEQTDLSLSNRELIDTMAIEFEEQLQGGPFLHASDVPTLADLSALPQIIVPRLRGTGDDLLPGQAVRDWVDRMLAQLPNYLELLPDVLVKGR